LNVAEKSQRVCPSSFVSSRPLTASHTLAVRSSDAVTIRVPHAFVIGRDGVLAWSGHPADKAFDEAVLKALAAK